MSKRHRRARRRVRRQQHDPMPGEHVQPLREATSHDFANQGQMAATTPRGGLSVGMVRRLPASQRGPYVQAMQRQHGNHYLQRRMRRPSHAPLRRSAMNGVVQANRFGRFWRGEADWQTDAVGENRGGFRRGGKAWLMGQSKKTGADNTRWATNLTGPNNAPTSQNILEQGKAGKGATDYVDAGISGVTGVVGLGAGAGGVAAGVESGLGSEPVKASEWGTSSDDLETGDKATLLKDGTATAVHASIGSGIGAVFGAANVLQDLGVTASAINKMAGGGLSKEEWADAIMSASRGGLSALLSGGMSIADAGVFIAKSVKAGGKDAGDKDLASTAGSVATGFGTGVSALGGLKDALSLFFNTIGFFKDAGMGVKEVFADEKGLLEVLATRGVGMLSKSLQVFQDVINIGGKIVDLVGKILTLAGTAEAFTQAVPIVGDSISIFNSALGIFRKFLGLIKRAYKMVKAVFDAGLMAWSNNKMNKAGLTNKVHDTTSDKLIEITVKRVKRQIVPVSAKMLGMLGDVSKIAGSIFNICGVATSPAYGTGAAIMGTGYALKGVGTGAQIGAAAMEGGQKAVRFGKQLSRDVVGGVDFLGKGNDWLRGKANWNADNPNAGPKMQKFNKFMKEKGKFVGAPTTFGLGVNTEKTSKKKNRAYANAAADIMTMLGGLPVFDKTNSDVVTAYTYAIRTIRVTSVNIGDFLSAAGDPVKQGKMLMKAMKKRE